MSEEEKKAIEYIKENSIVRIENEKIVAYGNSYKLILLNLIDKQQEEIEEKNCLIDVLQHKIEELLDNKKEINYIKPIDIPVHNYINEDKIRDRLKELEEQKEKLKYDGNRSFADYEQFCKNLKFFKEQIEEILEDK